MNKIKSMFFTVLTFIVVVTVTFSLAFATFISGFFCKDSVYMFTRAWAFLWLKSSGVRVKVYGLENIDYNGKYIIISNHLSSYDIPVIFSAFPLKIVFVAKKELFNIPILGSGMRTAGHIPIDRSSARKGRLSIQRAVDMIKRKSRSVLIFPEGTRGTKGKLKEFKQASFTLVKKSGVKMLPIFIKGTDRVAPKGKYLINPGEVEVYIGEPIASETIEDSAKGELKDMALQQIKRMQEENV